MRVLVAIAITAMLSGCSIRSSGLKPLASADGGRDGGGAGAGTDGGRADGGSDACLTCECRTAADCPAPRTERSECVQTVGGCDTRGTLQSTTISYLCNAGSCREDRNTVSEVCVVPTDGTSCGPPVEGSWGSCTASGCGTSGTRTRVVMDPVCAGGACTMISRTESDSCAVETSGDPCTGSLDCRGRCRSGSCDVMRCDGSGDCSGLCPGGSSYCGFGCCRCT